MSLELHSIITDDTAHCLICDSPNVCIHHVFEGVANRKLSDEDNLIVPLEPRLHNEGGKPELGERCDVHHCKKMAKLMHIIGQQAWMMEYIIEQRGLPFEEIKEEAKEAFRKRYGKSYL